MLVLVLYWVVVDPCVCTASAVRPVPGIGVPVPVVVVPDSGLDTVIDDGPSCWRVVAVYTPTRVEVLLVVKHISDHDIVAVIIVPDIHPGIERVRRCKGRGVVVHVDVIHGRQLKWRIQPVCVRLSGCPHYGVSDEPHCIASHVRWLVYVAVDAHDSAGVSNAVVSLPCFCYEESRIGIAGNPLGVQCGGV